MAGIRRSIWLPVILYVLVGPTSFALDFEFDLGIAPRLDGTYSAFLGTTVRYTDRFYSSLGFRYTTEEEESEDSGDNLTETTSVYSRTFAADLDVLGYNIVRRPFDLGLGASVTYMHFRADEELLYEADPGFTVAGGSELVLTNERTLQVVLPTASLRFEQPLGLVRLRLGGEYAPAVFVFLDQEADTDPPLADFTDDGPVRSSGVYQSGQSFSVDGELTLFMPIVVPSVAASYTHLPITYEIATVGGEQTVDTLIRELNLEANLAIRVISVLGFSPLIRGSYERSWTEIDGADDVVSTDEWLVYLGVTRI